MDRNEGRESKNCVYRKCNKVRKSNPTFQFMLNIGYGALQERAQGVRQQKNSKTCEIHKYETFHHILREVVSLDFKAKHWNPEQVQFFNTY